MTKEERKEHTIQKKYINKFLKKPTLQSHKRICIHINICNYQQKTGVHTETQTPKYIHIHTNIYAFAHTITDDDVKKTSGHMHWYSKKKPVVYKATKQEQSKSGQHNKIKESPRNSTCLKEQQKP